MHLSVLYSKCLSKTDESGFGEEAEGTDLTKFSMNGKSVDWLIDATGFETAESGFFYASGSIQKDSNFNSRGEGKTKMPPHRGVDV